MSKIDNIRKIRLIVEKSTLKLVKLMTSKFIILKADFSNILKIRHYFTLAVLVKKVEIFFIQLYY